MPHASRRPRVRRPHAPVYKPDVEGDPSVEERRAEISRLFAEGGQRPTVAQFMERFGQPRPVIHRDLKFVGKWHRNQAKALRGEIEERRRRQSARQAAKMKTLVARMERLRITEGMSYRAIAKEMVLSRNQVKKTLKEREQQVSEARARLLRRPFTPRQRQILSLWLVQRKSPEEVSREAGMTPGNVGSVILSILDNKATPALKERIRAEFRRRKGPGFKESKFLTTRDARVLNWASLTRRQREVLRHWLVDGLNQNEIARQLGVKRQAVSSIIKGVHRRAGPELRGIIDKRKRMNSQPALDPIQGPSGHQASS